MAQTSGVPPWLVDAVREFGVACKEKLAGPGDREAAIRAPLEILLREAGTRFGFKVVPHDEARDVERAVRPDYAVSVSGAITGYVEVKRPGASIDPAAFTGHNLTQWERLRDLPNLVYTNGTEWRLWRDGQLVSDGHLAGPGLASAGTSLQAWDGFEALLRDFLDWRPAPIRRIGPLVRAVAPLTRLLKAEVMEQLEIETERVQGGASRYAQPFTGLANDWRKMLFPHADDKTFANGYAQAITFALLLAKSENLSLAKPLNEVGTELGQAHHTLMGRALQLLTADVAAEFKVTLDLLVRVIDAVRWNDIVKASRPTGSTPAATRNDPYLYLYEHFLAEYDPDWRKLSGSYYTPIEVVTNMVRLADEALRSNLGRAHGFADPSVTTVDPAMGTGTYPNVILKHVADEVEADEGAGAVPGSVSELAKRLIGFELQMGPYAVAELRTAAVLKSLQARAPADGLRLYVTNTLDDPYVEVGQLATMMEPVAQSRRRANNVKANTRVTVVIGNPPYAENAAALGGWIEHGNPHLKQPAPMNAFRTPGDGRYVQNLKNLYVYFWRWATWKVFDAHADDNTGIVCFISTSGYLRGPGFRGMREYLRRTCTAGWVIDLTPEGQTPDVPTRIFPGVRQPLAIGLLVRDSSPDPETPAVIRYRAVHGRQEDKFRALGNIRLDDDGWRSVRTSWQAPLTAAATSNWDDMPALDDLFPWTTPGLSANRTWPIGPTPTILTERWNRLLSESDPAEQDRLFKNSVGVTMDTAKEPLPSLDAEQHTDTPLRAEWNRHPKIVRIGYRSFDRQYAIADSRVWHRPRPPLWAARVPRQLFLFELHSSPVISGPGAVFTDLVPDMHYFKGSEGGRVLPLLHPGGRPNVARGLLNALSALVATEPFGGTISHDDLAAYVAAVVSHPGYTVRFADELTTPGCRVPITADPALFAEAVVLGKQVLWAHTYGQRYADPAHGRPSADIRFPTSDPNRILNNAAVTAMPDDVRYDAQSSTVVLGTGRWGPVRKDVFEYAVGGKNVIRSWVNYRKQEPGGRRSSPLDDLNVTTWPSKWSTELTDLLTVLTRLVRLQDAQDQLLEQVLGGAPLSRATLSNIHGVVWPTATDRRPNYVPLTEHAREDSDQLPFR